MPNSTKRLSCAGEPPVEIFLHRIPGKGFVQTQPMGELQEDVLVVAALAGGVNDLDARKLSETRVGGREQESCGTGRERNGARRIRPGSGGNFRQ
jgi:hypothetical protein